MAAHRPDSACCTMNACTRCLLDKKAELLSVSPGGGEEGHALFMSVAPLYAFGVLARTVCKHERL